MHPNALVFEAGQRFGKLSVVRLVEERHGHHIQWLCKCDCGNELPVKAGWLKAGLKQSCGCLAREWRDSRPNTKKMEGQRFGKLTVTDHAGKNRSRSVLWKCVCDCGQSRTVDGGRLRDGSVTCCGCSAQRTVMATPNDGTKTCSACGEKKPLSEFEKSEKCWAGVARRCKKCRSVSKGRDWMMWRYGITIEQVNQLKLDQEGRCKICLRPTKKLCVDHCHTTMRVRGLLCGSCNSALGLFGENETTMRRAIEYLKPPADSTAILLAQTQ